MSSSPWRTTSTTGALLACCAAVGLTTTVVRAFVTSTTTTSSTAAAAAAAATAGRSYFSWSSSSWWLSSLLGKNRRRKYTPKELLQPSLTRRAFSSSNTSGSMKDDSDAKTQKQQQQQQQQPRFRTVQEEMEAAGGALTVQPMGVVRSVYRLCVGTPRQGLLAPHARGRIELLLDNAAMARDAVDGLEQVSHVWIVFVFHHNSRGSRTPAKIAPPAAGGCRSSATAAAASSRRVGVLATRSPHRFNPIGLTLAKLDGVVTERSPTDQHKRPMLRTYLRVSGLDLVDGTPVLDIKPYVPMYDAPPLVVPNQNHQDDPGMDMASSLLSCRLPSWIQQGLVTQRPVEWSEQATSELRQILLQDENALEFYGRRAGWDTSFDETVRSVTACISEVLAMDVRSQFQTHRARSGLFKAEQSQRLRPRAAGEENNTSTSRSRSTSPSTDDVDDDEDEDENGDCHMQEGDSDSSTCTQQIDNLLVHFSVVEKTSDLVQRQESLGSGAEDLVLVQSIQLLGIGQ